MKKILLTDFDGPIMDVSERYYQVYLYCLAQLSGSLDQVVTLSKPEFWELKRSQVPEKEIAKLSGFVNEEQVNTFAQLRGVTVHTDPYFQYDRLIESAIPALELVQSSGFDLAVITMRRSREIEPVLDQYNLRRFFPSDRIFCLDNDYVKTVDIQDKPKLMKLAQETLPKFEQQWMIGDTEADIISAQGYDVPAIAVLSGIRNKVQLEKYKPSQIFADLITAVTSITTNC